VSRHIFARLFTRQAISAVLAVGLWPVAPVAAGQEGLAGTVLVKGRPERNVVVWLEDGTGARPVATRKVVLDQRQLQFKPHVLAVRVGTEVEMPNSDRVFHNVFSFHDGKRFDLGLYPVGTARTVTFDRPGLSRIFCNIHPNMAAYVLAVDSGYFAVSDSQGQFILAGVPLGSYTYHAWRPGGQTTTGIVVVGADRKLEIRWP
jgi:plastocyanin